MSLPFLVKLYDKNLSKTPDRDYESAGWNCYAYGNHIISPKDCKIIPLGFSAALPKNHVAVVWDRSSFGNKKIHTFHQLIRVPDDLQIVSFGGVIDSDYRGIWGAILYNFSNKEFEIKHGDKVVQIIIHEVADLEQHIVDELPSSERGGKGFGSTDQGMTAEKLHHTIMGAPPAPPAPKEAEAQNTLIMNSGASVTVTRAEAKEIADKIRESK